MNLTAFIKYLSTTQNKKFITDGEFSEYKKYINNPLAEMLIKKASLNK